jgi:hypothetical protein
VEILRAVRKYIARRLQRKAGYTNLKMPEIGASIKKKKYF